MKEEKCQPTQFEGKLSVLCDKVINDTYKVIKVTKYKNFYDVNSPELQVNVALLKVLYFDKAYEVNRFGYLVYAALPCAKDKMSLHRRFIVDDKDRFLGYYLVTNWGSYNAIVDAVDNYIFYSLEDTANKKYKEAVEALTQDHYPFLKLSKKVRSSKLEQAKNINNNIKLLKTHISLMQNRLKKMLDKIEDLEEKLYE